MNVTVIKTRDEFYQLQQTWDAIHAKDPDATAFQSWAWLCGWIESTPHEWFVLAIQQHETCQSAHAHQARGASTHIVSESEPYVAFMALSRRSINNEGSRLSMGGTPFVDHTGFVCVPEFVDEAMPALAAFIRDHVEWDTFQLRNVSDPRLDLFLKHLSSKRISIHENKGTSCPYIPLPESWDQYFKEFLGGSTRQNFRNYLNRIKRLDGFHATEIQSGNMESQIEILLSLWQARWGLRSDDLYAGLRLEDVLILNVRSSAPVLKIIACG